MQDVRNRHVTTIQQWRPGGAAAAWWSEATEGSKALVAYQDDPVVHVRIMILPAGPRGEKDQWWVYTPDGDMYVEDLSGGDPLRGVASSAPLTEGEEPAVDIYHFREYPNRAAVANLKAEARMCTYRNLNEFKAAASQTEALPEFMTAAAVEDARPRQGGVGSPGPPVNMAAKEKPGYSWLLAEPLGAWEIGSVLRTSECKGVAYGTRAFLKLEGVHVAADLVETDRVKEYEEERREFLRRACHPSDLVVAPGEGFANSSTPRGEAEPPRGVEDGRTLWVDWDAHGVRYKAWREVVAESTQLTFEDNPDAPAGGNTAIHMARAMERKGGDPKRWLECWCRDERLETGDRSVFELRSLCEIFSCLGSYDQCNLGGILSAELVARRVAAIVDAYAVPSRPSWHAAKHFQGQDDEIIAPGLRTHVTRRRREENDLFTAEQRRAPGPNTEGGGGEGDGNDAGAGRKGDHGKA